MLTILKGRRDYTPPLPPALRGMRPPVSGYEMWLDAAYSPGFYGDQQLAVPTAMTCHAWIDRSASGNEATSTASSNLPTWGTTNNINNRPCVHFPSAGVGLASNLSRSTIATTLCVVGVITSLAAVNTVITTQTNAAGLDIYVDTAGKLNVDKRGIANLVKATNAITTNTPFAFTVQTDGSSARCVVNGTVTSASPSTSLTASLIAQIGADPVNNTPFRGHLGEMISYASKLTNQNCTDILSYFTTKWATT